MSTPQEFGAKALKAALGAIKVYLVGPNGAQGHLEKTAIKIDDYRLRDDVLYNFLMIKHVLHGSELRDAAKDRIGARNDQQTQ